MTNKPIHICICICTYRRPSMLKNLLTRLQVLKTNQSFTYSILVVDNDRALSAKEIVNNIQIKSQLAISYHIAEIKNIPIARNQAVQNASGDLIAFIDDDEMPTDDWLLNLFKTYQTYGSDGVLGPVRPIFEEDPPDWILKARLFERPSYPTGLVMHWDRTRSGNMLLRRDIFNDKDNLFNPSYTHGEDKDFFKRMTAKGLVFVWCEEAPVYEKQLKERFTRNYFLRRALIRGSVAMRHRCFKGSAILKSAIAVIIYTLALPFLQLAGHYLFMKYLIKDFDHIGALMAALKMDVAGYFEKKQIVDEAQ